MSVRVRVRLRVRILVLTVCVMISDVLEILSQRRKEREGARERGESRHVYRDGGAFLRSEPKVESEHFHAQCQQARLCRLVAAATRRHPGGTGAHARTRTHTHTPATGIVIIRQQASEMACKRGPYQSYSIVCHRVRTIRDIPYSSLCQVTYRLRPGYRSD